MESNSTSSQFLHYGSLITIKTAENYYLYSKGFIDNNPLLQDGLDSVHDLIGAVFRIIPQCMFSTQKEILRYISDSQRGVQSSKVSRLEEALDGEIKTNIHTYNNFKGEAIKYGSLIQLEHIQSHKFLTLNSQKSSEVERENLKLSLEDYGSEYSHFRIEPSFRYQKEGNGLVRLNDKVHFEIAIPELNRMAFLHSSKDTLILPPISRLVTGISVSGSEEQPNSLEINVSLDKKTRWAINLYAPFVKDSNQYLSCGDYIWLTRVEEQVCLCANFRQMGHQRLKMIFNENLSDTNGLWKIEAENKYQGGLVNIESRYRLKHIASGKYLTIKERKSSKLTKSSVKTLEFHKLKLGKILHANNLWKFVPLEAKPGKKYLESEELCKLVNVNLDASFIGKEVLSSKNITKFAPSVTFNVDELTYIKLSRAGGAIVWETLFLLNCYPILCSFPEYVSRNSSLIEMDSKAIKEYEKYMILINKCITDLELFCNNKLQSMVGMDNQYGEVQKARQRMLKEQQFFEALAQILDYALQTENEKSRVEHLQWNSNMYVDYGSLNQELTDFFSPRINDLDPESMRIKCLALVITNTYRLISVICHRNYENQLYAFQFFKIFMKHVGLNVGATKCMLDILRENEKLLLEIHEAKNDNIIAHYTNLLKFYQHEKKPQLLDFLKTICVYKGDSIAVNQEKIFNYIFSSQETKDQVLISTTMINDEIYITAETGDEPVSLRSCFFEGKIIDYPSTIIYFIKLLELYANLCFGRNYMCTEYLKEKFSLKTLQNMMANENLSKQLRAALVKLSLSIYVDTYPREEFVKPELIKVLILRGGFSSGTELVRHNTRFLSEDMRTINVSPKSVQNIRKSKKSIFRNLGKAAEKVLKFKASGIVTPLAEEIDRFNEEDRLSKDFLKTVIGYFDNQAELTNYDVLTYEILRVANKQLRFELFGTVCTDFINEYVIRDPRSGAFRVKNMDLLRFLASVSKIYLKQHPSISERSKMFKKRASKLFTEDEEDSGKKTIKSSFLTGLLNDPTSLSDPIIRCAANLRNFLYLLRQSALQNPDQKNYENRIKIKICRMLHYYLDWRQEFLINNITQWFNTLEDTKNWKNAMDIKSLLPKVMKITKSSNMASIEHMVADIYDSDFNKYYSPKIPDLNAISDKPILYQLLKVFVSSTDHLLQSLTLKLIIRCFKQREEFLLSVKRLYVISSEGDKLLLRWVKKSLTSFRQYSEQSELWLNYWKQNDYLKVKYWENFQSVMNFLVKLGDIFYEDTYIKDGEPSIGNKGTISKARQDMLYYLGAHNLIIRLLKDGMHTLADLYEAPNEHIQEPRLHIRELFTQCHKILRRFVYMHTRNQKRLHKHIHVFLQHLRIDVDQIPLICEIYKDNYSLLSQINKDILKRFKKVIYSEGRRPIYLEFLDVIQCNKGKPISQNQRYVINFFVKEEFNRFLLYMNKDPEPEFIFEAERPKNASWSYQDIPYEYHGKLLAVLSKCGFGVSGMYLNEAKCQKIFRLPSIFKLLEQAENKSNPFYRLKIPILDFLFNIYIDCEKTNDDVKESADFIAYMKSQVELVSKISTLDSSYVMFLQIWVKILTKYCNSHLNTREAYMETKEDFLAIQAYAQALFDNHKIFYSRKVPESLITSISFLCSKFGLEFPIIQYEEYHDIAMDPFDSLVLLRDDSKYELKDYSSEAIECWNQVKEELLYDDGIKEYLKLEQKALSIAIYRAEDLEEGLTFDNIIESLINFIRSSRSQQDDIDTIVSAIELLASLIENPICNPYDDAEEIKIKIQDQLNTFGVSRVVLALMCDPEVNKQVFHALLELSIQLLDGGNNKVQQEFYQYFIGVAGSEYFFEKIHNTLLENVSKLASGHISEITRVPVYKAKKVQMRRILRVLQLFCEGHFTKLQNYIRHQEKSRASYNIIDDIVSLLDMLLKKMYFKHFFEISQCFDTLTEAIQGPCKENQESIIDGKFLELAAYLLSLDENSGGVQVYEALKGDRDFIHLESIKSSQSADKIDTISGWMISHLKYKCMITLLSLLEGRNDNYVISRIIRAFNVEIFKENLISIYDGYIKHYKKVLYTDQIFNHHAKNDEYQFGFPDNPQDKNPEYFTVIIEVGFMIYHLMKCFHDNDDPENREVVEEELPELELEEDTNVFFAKKILGDLGKVGFALVKDTMNTVAKATDILSLGNSRGPALEKSGILEAAYDFFGKYTGNIEVVFNGSLTKVYFSLPPEFVGLNKEIKEDFHNNADRTSDQTKLRYLMLKADGIVEQIKNNHKMEMLFQKYPFVSVLTSNVTLWGELVFYLTLILNFFIIFSYAYYGDMTLYKPSLFYEETGSSAADGGLNVDETKKAIQAIGIVLVICTVFIVGVFLLKTGPVLAKRGWNKNEPTIEFWKNNPSKRKIALKRLKQSLWTLLYVWSNWNVIYYCLYFAVALCGVVVHPFYFSLLLLDMLYRYPALQNVIKSITMPKKALILTFIFMLVIVYIFGLVGFWKFSEYFNGNCPSLFFCFLNVWDKGFKANGGIGGYLKQWTDGSMNTGRLIYDNLYNIIIMIIMLNIVQGIIIDTFAILREAHERNTSDRENKCYICGMERDLIERVTSKPFRYHTLREHHEWNYILYIAYLRAKEETEYTGIESYVREQIDNKDFQWFPQHQALSVKEESNTEEKRLLDSALRMEEKLALMEEEIKKFKNIY